MGLATSLVRNELELVAAELAGEVNHHAQQRAANTFAAAVCVNDKILNPSPRTPSAGKIGQDEKIDGPQCRTVSHRN